MSTPRTFLFYLGHPAHYHNIRLVADNLGNKGHQIILVAREKDVLLDLVKGSPHQVYVVDRKKGDGKLVRGMGILRREWDMLRIARKHKPALMVGTDFVITHIGKLLGIPSVVMNEDDADEVPLFVRFAYPYATSILAPNTCPTGKYEGKTIHYPGYQELSYLHPNYFQPDPEKIKLLSPDGKPYFILRFAKLTAHHDDGKTGISIDLALKIIDKLSPHGRIFITSERKLETRLEKYRIIIHPRDIHHALNYAEMYIGDSQTMAAEAAVMGTPSLRYNDFVGKLGYLEELQHRFELTQGIETGLPEKVLETIDSWLKMPERKEVWKKRKENMLEQCLDVNSFLTWYFEDFPQSHEEVVKNPAIMSRFGGN